MLSSSSSSSSSRSWSFRTSIHAVPSFSGDPSAIATPPLALMWGQLVCLACQFAAHDSVSPPTRASSASLLSCASLPSSFVVPSFGFVFPGTGTTASVLSSMPVHMRSRTCTSAFPCRLTFSTGTRMRMRASHRRRRFGTFSEEESQRGADPSEF